MIQFNHAQISDIEHHQDQRFAQRVIAHVRGAEGDTAHRCDDDITAALDEAKRRGDQFDIASERGLLCLVVALLTLGPVVFHHPRYVQPLTTPGRHEAQRLRSFARVLRDG